VTAIRNAPPNSHGHCAGAQTGRKEGLAEEETFAEEETTKRRRR
jgi:hypothetical protein